jgi:hypothetical protein
MSLEIIQLSNYIRPEVKEVMSKEYVLNGDKNSFYQYIIDRYNGSPTNRAIIDSYSQFIYGKGLTSKQMNTKPVQFAMIGQILSKKNLKNICQDYYLFGESSMELIYEKGTLKQILHIPKNQVVPNKMNEEGDIENYWYSLDFNNTRKYKPLQIPKFENKDKKKNGSFIYIISNYQVGKTYFADPSYLAALPYAELEEEIANYCINHIKNGLSFGHIFNMNNGEPESPEVKRKILSEIKVEGKGSSNANKTFVNWNLGVDTAITIESLEVSDAHKQYEFLSGESSQKLITGHRVVSPMLFGIKDSTGFGNNADEMESAFNELMINVIQPKQEVVLDALMEIFIDNGMTIDLDFIPLRTIVQPTQLSAHTHETDSIIADSLIELGEDLDLNEWESVDEEAYSETSIKLSEVSLNLARTIYGQPLKSSELDTNFFKVRFEYAGNLAPEREFCRKMIGAGKVFRLEDIENASSKAVNAGWGPEGADTYDILKYKGGGNCKHYWLRKIYLKKNNSYITVEKAQKMIRDLKELGISESLPKSGEPLSTIKPTDMPNNGFLNKR